MYLLLFARKKKTKKEKENKIKIHHRINFSQSVVTLPTFYGSIKTEYRFRLNASMFTKLLMLMIS